LKSFEHNQSESFASLSLSICKNQQDSVKLFRETEAREMIKIKLFAAKHIKNV